ncbi:MAG: NUDIX domain-containing protein [Bacillota bacterium]
MDNLREKTQKKVLICRGNFLELYQDQVVLPNGKVATREYLHHPGAIAAAPLLDSGEILLVKQFRYPTGSVLLEIPAGKLDPGEEPEVCVERELMEEIGYRPSQITHLISIWTTPGFTDEIIHLYLAKGLKPAFREKDSDEFLEVVAMSKEKLMEQLTALPVVDGKTALALTIMALRKLW